MVLSELGSSISSALRSLGNESVIDMAVVDKMLKEVAMALLQADVNVKLVSKMRSSCKNSLKELDSIPAGVNKRKLIQQVVFDSLRALVEPGRKPFVPKKGQQNVVMFVGLQGSGKTTTCTKLAHYYKRKGWQVGLVCADTFRAGAFDQLRQNATKAKVPFYGSYQESDPVEVAREGVKRFKDLKYDLIIVDTSGRHKQEDALFDEMKSIHSAVDPHDVLLVMDSSIGQAAHAQASAFREAVDVGSVVITKMDGHAKGGGALSAVAATESPILFIGTGEHMGDFEQFESGPFVSKLLGMGDIGGLIQKAQEAGFENQAELMEKLMKGNQAFSLTDMKGQLETIMNMGPLGQVMSMIPGMSNLKLPQGSEEEQSQVFKKLLVLMDSMTGYEMDNPKVLAGDKGKSRCQRICRGSGCSMADMDRLMMMLKQMEKMMSGMRGIAKNPNATPQQQMQMMAKNMNPQMLRQLGGMGNLQNMMSQMGNMDPSMMQKMMKGGGGGGMPGMPNLPF